MKPKYAPGPWKNKGDCDFSGRLSIQSPDQIIGFAFGAGQPVGEATANLIAAAPELLEALIEVWAQVDTSSLTESTVKKINSSIRKAQGKNE